MSSTLAYAISISLPLVWLWAGALIPCLFMYYTVGCTHRGARAWAIGLMTVFSLNFSLFIYTGLKQNGLL